MVFFTTKDTRKSGKGSALFGHVAVTENKVCVGSVYLELPELARSLVWHDSIVSGEENITLVEDDTYLILVAYQHGPIV